MQPIDLATDDPTAGRHKLGGPPQIGCCRYPVLQLHTLNSKQSLVVMNSLSSASAMSRICTRKERVYVLPCRVSASCTQVQGQHTYILKEELGQA